MLKKVMAMLASRYKSIKVRLRAIETHLMIQSLLLRDKKMVRHLFHRRKFFKHEPHTTQLSNSVAATTPPSMVQAAEEIDDVMEMEDDDGYPNSLSDDNSEIATTTPSVVQVAEAMEDMMDMEDDDVYPHSPSEDDPEMVKNAKTGQGEEFELEEDIDRVADLFIQRFHHQIAAEATL